MHINFPTQCKFRILVVCSWGIVMPLMSRILKFGGFNSEFTDDSSSHWNACINMYTKFWQFWTEARPNEANQDSYTNLAYFSAVLDTYYSITLNFLEVHCFLSAYAVYHATKKLCKIFHDQCQSNLDIRVRKFLKLACALWIRIRSYRRIKFIGRYSCSNSKIICSSLDM